jgi:hypothetical protein
MAWSLSRCVGRTVKVVLSREKSSTFRDVACLVLPEPCKVLVLSPWHPLLVLTGSRLLGPLHVGHEVVLMGWYVWVTWGENDFQ